MNEQVKHDWLTPDQRNFLTRRNLKIGGSSPLPRWGFHVYSKPDVAYGEWLDANPFTKSIDGVYVKIISFDHIFVQVNFSNRPCSKNFYIPKHQLEKRDIFEIIFLFAFAAPLMVFRNIYLRFVHPHRLNRLKGEVK